MFTVCLCIEKNNRDKIKVKFEFNFILFCILQMAFCADEYGGSSQSSAGNYLVSSGDDIPDHSIEVKEEIIKSGAKRERIFFSSHLSFLPLHFAGEVN